MKNLFSDRKHKVRGLYGYWTDSLYSIDIDRFEAYLKQQKKEMKNALKNPPQKQTMNLSTRNSSEADSADPDEELPDVDPSHEQLNLPPNSLTLWRIMPKLEYATQVNSFIKNFLLFLCFHFV